MDYDLAKKLKDGGFSQKMKSGDYGYYKEKLFTHTGGGHIEPLGRTEGLYLEVGSMCCFSNYDEDLKYFDNIYDDLITKVPTLSELIEACGDEFVDLERFNNGKWGCNKIYNCLNCTPEGWDDWVVTGDTPEEVVSLLWLALDKNE